MSSERRKEVEEFTHAPPSAGMKESGEIAVVVAADRDSKTVMARDKGVACHAGGNPTADLISADVTAIDCLAY